jgi:hypothetical protein
MKIMVNMGFCFFITIMGMFPANTNTLSAQAHAASIKSGQSGISAIVGLWKDIDHVHQNCRARTPGVCKAYKMDLLFKKDSGGRLRADMVGLNKAQKYHLVGLLKRQTWTYKSYNSSGYEGFGTIVFSPDFRSFQGEGRNSTSTHNVVWTGRR